MHACPKPECKGVGLVMTFSKEYGTYWKCPTCKTVYQ